MSNASKTPDPFLLVNVRDTKQTSHRIPVVDKPDPVTGKFWFVIEVTAMAKDIYIPLSIASGKKPTGFVYQLEGTAESSIVTTAIECRGEGITQVTLGTIVYCKIPLGMTATFHIRIEMRGKLGKAYKVGIRQIHYKFDPGDTRYQKSVQEIQSRMEKF